MSKFGSNFVVHGWDGEHVLVFLLMITDSLELGWSRSGHDSDSNVFVGGGGSIFSRVCGGLCRCSGFDGYDGGSERVGTRRKRLMAVCNIMLTYFLVERWKICGW